MSWGKLPDNPFVGLRPFESHESLLFFGRREQSVELLEQLHETRFLAVVGSSGSGKSSLVRAGLIPKLQAGFLVDDRDGWQVATLKPGDAPLANLASALWRQLASHAGVTVGEFTEELRERGVIAVLERAAAALADGNANLLVLVDQFEELFRFGLHTAGGARGEEAAQFVSILLELAAQRELPIYVAMTMRSDFLGDCDAFLGLPEAMNRSQYLVPRLTRSQRREAIEGPVKLYRAAIAPRLVDRLLNETIDARDDLPVLQHALMRTWAAWDGTREGPIDVEHYVGVGTILGALSQHAEEAMAGRSVGDQELTRRIFQALTETDAGNRRIRRPARLSEIEAITDADRDAILEIIDRFRSDGRSFLVVSGDVEDGDASVDISHESLIRQWGRLEEWVDEEAESARIYRRLAETTALYRQGKAELYRGAALETADRWRELQAPNPAWARHYDPDLNRALEFLRTSRETEQRDSLQREERRRRELRRTRLVAAVLGIAFLLTLVLGFWALRQKKIANEATRQALDDRQAALDAKEEADEALLRAEASEKDAIIQGERATASQQEAEAEAARAERSAVRAAEQTALALARQQEAEAAREETETQRRQALARYLESQAEEVLGASGESIVLSALLATESLAAAATDEGKAAWRSAFDSLPQALLSFPGDPATAVAFSPDGEMVAAARVAIQPGSVLLERNGELVLYERRTGRELRRTEPGHPVQRLLFSPDGMVLVAAGEGRATVFATTDLAVLTRTEAWSGTAEVPGLAFSADGRLLVLGVAGYLHVLDAQDWTAEVRGVGLPDYAISVAAGPGEGALVDFVTTGTESLVAIDLEAPSDPVVGRWPFASLGIEGTSCDVPIVTDSDGRLFAASGSDIVLCTLAWDSPEPSCEGSGRGLAAPGGSECGRGARSLAFDETSRRQLVVTGGGTASLVDLGTPFGLYSPRSPSELGIARFGVSLNDDRGRQLRDHLASGDLSRDGSWMVTAGSALVLWDTRNLGQDIERRRLAGDATDSAWADGGPLVVSHGPTLTVFDPATWNEIAAVDAGCAARRIEISPDGVWMAARCDDSLRVLETESWRAVHALDLEGLTGLQFSPDGTILIALTEQEGLHTVELLTTGSWQRTTLEHDRPVIELLWGPRPGFFATRTRRTLTRRDFPDHDSPGRWAAEIGTTRVWELAAPGGPVAVRRDTRAQGQAPVENGSVTEGRTALLPEINMATTLPLSRPPALDPSQSSLRVDLVGLELRISSEAVPDLLDEACSRLPGDLDTTRSVTYFAKAEPRTTCADRATAHRARGRDLARLGYPVPAAAALRHALELDPSLGFDADAEQRTFAAQGALEEGRDLARRGEIDAARRRLATALELSPSLILDPEAEVRRLAPETPSPGAGDDSP